MSNKSVERVMLAIFRERMNINLAENERYNGASIKVLWRYHDPQARKLVEAQARAAMSAQLEPTDRQLKAALRLADIDEDLARTVWGVMQTAALEDDR